METKFKLLTWNVEEDRLFFKDYDTENEALQTALALHNRRIFPHDMIGLIRTNKTGHKWELTFLDYEGSKNIEYIYFYSKKDAKFAMEKLKEYDDTFKLYLTKIY